MKYNLFWVIVFACVSLYNIPSGQSQTIAIVNEIQGQVSIIRASGDTLKAEQFSRLYEGDKIRVSADSQVTLLLQGGDIRKIYENTNFTIHRNSNPGQQKNLLKKVWELLTGKNDVMRGKQVTGAVRGSDTVVTKSMVQPNFPNSKLGKDKTLSRKEILLSPRRGKVCADDLSFIWKSVPGITKYELVIFDTMGTRVFNITLSDTCFNLDPQSKILKTGNFYKCSISGFALKHNFYDSGTFYILDEEESKRIEKEENLIKEHYNTYDNFSQHVILAAFFEKQAMYYNAEKTLSELRTTETENPHFWYLLANLHQAIGLNLLAKNEGLLAARLKKKE